MAELKARKVRVFISYRHDDSAGHAGRVHDRLVQAFGRDLLFMDEDAIPLGVDFIKVLREEVAKCDVLLAVIGTHWLDARDEEGNRRLDSTADFVRIEIATALQRGIPVIPILLDGAKIPKVQQLPQDLEGLVARNGLDVRHASFHADMDKLIGGLKGASIPVDQAATRLGALGSGATRPRWLVIGLAAAIGAGAIAAALIVKQQTERSPRQLSPPVVQQSPVIGQPAPSSVPQPPAAKIEPSPQNAQLQSVPLAAPPFVPIPSTREHALQPGDSFKECDNCPEMVVVPIGSFIMGSPETEIGRGSNEGPQHLVTFAYRLAVGRFSVTFDEWDACVADGGCNGYSPPDQEWGRGRRPVINVSWNDVKTYLAWLSHKIAKSYRLPSEAEREYVTRAGTTTPFWWGSSISTSQANYKGTETYGDDGVRGEFRNQSLPVDSFAPNPWGLYQVHGNVSEWTEDCRHDNYIDAPTDGSVWIAPNCNQRVRRGGSIGSPPSVLRSASRLFGRATDAYPFLGFRVARTLTP
jgi:formylglycine-generating enzyme required for sulfatase activity